MCFVAGYDIFMAVTSGRGVKKTAMKKEAHDRI